jgi:hypothetical protein
MPPAADSDHEFEASVLSDSLLDRKPRKRAINLALGLDELYRGGTKKLKVGSCLAVGGAQLKPVYVCTFACFFATVQVVWLQYKDPSLAWLPGRCHVWSVPCA